jgi:hypothetical protein
VDPHVLGVEAVEEAGHQDLLRGHVLQGRQADRPD